MILILGIAEIVYFEFIPLIIDVNISLKSVFQKLLERLLLTCVVVDLVFIFLFNLQLKLRNYWTMVCEIDLLNTPIQQLPHARTSAPQDSITECRNALLLARIIRVCPQIIFVCRLEVDGPLLKLIEKQLHVLLVSRLLLLDCLARRFSI